MPPSAKGGQKWGTLSFKRKFSARTESVSRLPAVAGVAAVAATSTVATASAAPATAETTSTAAAETAAPALGFRASFVNVDGASAELTAIERSDGLLAVFVAVHFDEAESTGASSIAIGHDAHAVDLTVTFKNLPQLVFTSVEAEVPHKDVLHASSPALICRKCELVRGLAGRKAFLEILTGAGEQSNAREV